MVIHFWFGVGIGFEVIKRKNKTRELYLILPFIRIRLKHYNKEYYESLALKLTKELSN
jgi:hypothetical protein